MEHNDVDAPIAANLKAWDAKRTAERGRAFAQLRATWDAMLAQAGDTEAREAALAWCRQRIDVPPTQPFPLGAGKVSTLKQWFADDDAPALVELDATLRAAAEVALTGGVARH